MFEEIRNRGTKAWDICISYLFLLLPCKMENKGTDSEDPNPTNQRLASRSAFPRSSAILKVESFVSSITSYNLTLSSKQSKSSHKRYCRNSYHAMPCSCILCHESHPRRCCMRGRRIHCCSAAEREPLIPKREVLGYRLVVALSILNVQVHQVVWVKEEHVLRLIQILEPRRVVRELVARVGGSRVPAWESR